MTANASIATFLEHSAQERPEDPAVILDSARLTYAELRDASRSAAGLLRREGIEPGDRVAIMLPNILAFPVLFFGALRLGAVVVPMNPLFTQREIEHYLADSGATVLCSIPSESAAAAATEHGVRHLTVDPADPAGLAGLLAGSDPVDKVAVRGPEEDAVILYTSGTTGRPKGAQLTHHNLRTNAETVVEELFDLGSGDVIMGCLPLFHIFGLTCGLLASVRSGAVITLIPRFDPAKALEVIARDRVTIFEGVPTMYGAMLAASAETPGASLETLRLAVSGGASLPVELLNRFESTFDCTILEGYGLSETSPVATFNRVDRRRPGSIGLPVRGVELTLMTQDGTEVPAGDAETVGEVTIRGENIMKGYWGNPQKTAEAITPEGWFRTGDLGRRDGEGFYYIVDRTKDLIIRGGYNVYPREVEEVLYEHPAVAQAAVVGVPHAELGQEVAAFVVLAAGERATVEELTAFVKERVAPYKYPRQLTLLDDLPKSATGKILKRELVPDA